MTRIFIQRRSAVLPLEVSSKRGRDARLARHGMSVMEMSHRGKEFISIHAQARKTCAS